MSKLKSLFSRINHDIYRRYQDIDLMEKLLLEYSEVLLPGKYFHLLANGSMIIFVHERQSKIPKALEQTLESYWKKSPSNTYLIKLYISLIEVIWGLINFFRLKILKKNKGLVLSRVFNDKSLINAVIVLIRKNGKILLIDSEKKRIYFKHVKPFSINPAVDYASEEKKEYLKLRSYFASNFNSPKSHGYVQDFFSEELLTGDNIAFMSLDERILVIKQICSSCIEAEIATKNNLIPAEILETGLRIVKNHLHNSSLSQELHSRESAIIKSFNNWKPIYSHNDLTAHNLIICEGLPFVVDLAPHKIGIFPSFLMPATLIHSENFEYGRSDLLEAFYEGEFDREFSQMLSMEIDNKEKRENILLSETIILSSIGSKLSKNSLKWWLESVF